MYKNARKEDLIRVVEDLDAKVEEKQFETLNKETATYIGIREAEDWFRPIDLAKECDIYISSKNGSRKEIPIACGYTQDPFKNRSQNFKPKIKENYPQYFERENKNCFICGDSSHYARDCEKRFKPKESNDHIPNRINVNTLKVNGAMKTSSVDFNSQQPNPLPMKSKHRRFAMLRKIFEPLVVSHIPKKVPWRPLLVTKIKDCAK
ncbi:hypothetical protein TNCV_4109941 [Trichonephila clavipes]|nr:hypothetical protein TNCV_4109941 [Trichonephila clavipes]